MINFCYLLYILNLVLIASPQDNVFFSNPYPPQSTALRTIDQIFLNFPHETQIQQIILNADIHSLSKLLQVIQVKSHEIDCQTMIMYSNEVLGMIRTAIQKFTHEGNELEAIIENAKLKINRLSKENTNLILQKHGLAVDAKVQQLQRKVNQLNTVHDLFNKAQKSIDPKKTKILGHQSELKLNEINIKTEKQSINLKNIAVGQLDASILKLQNELNTLKNKKTKFENEISKNQNKLNEYFKKADDEKLFIKDLQQEIQSIKQSMDNLKKLSLSLEVQTQKLRQDINLSKAKESALLMKIQQNNEVINEIYVLADDEEYFEIREKLQSLKAFFMRFRRQNSEFNFRCYGEGNIQIIRIQQQIVYLIQGSRLRFYLSSAYGKAVSLPSTIFNNDITLQQVDIFGQVWERQYGRPFNTSALEEEQVVLEGDFTCLNPSKIKSGNGVILGIEKNRVYVLGNSDKIITLSLGACTRIESSSSLPKVNQNIYFKGILLPQMVVNAYVVSVF